jgi:hypothetical protein
MQDAVKRCVIRIAEAEGGSAATDWFSTLTNEITAAARVALNEGRVAVPTGVAPQVFLPCLILREELRCCAERIGEGEDARVASEWFADLEGEIVFRTKNTAIEGAAMDAETFIYDEVTAHIHQIFALIRRDNV